MFKRNERKKKVTHKFLSVFLASAMILSSLPITGMSVSAEELSTDTPNDATTSSAEELSVEESSSEESSAEELSVEESSAEESSQEQTLTDEIVVGNIIENVQKNIVQNNDLNIQSAVGVANETELNKYENWGKVAISAVSGTDYVVDADGNLTVKTAKGLAWFANDVNSGNNYNGKTVTLANDIDLTTAGVVGYALDAEGELSTVTEDNSWISIGTYETKLYFSGTFDGGNHTVSGIYINTIYAENGAVTARGLFGYARGNVTIKDVTVDGYVKSTEDSAGTLVGFIGQENINARIENCHNKGTVSGSRFVGGLIGQVNIYSKTGGSTADIINCSNVGKINASTYGAGGIVGMTKCSRSSSNGSVITIENCHNTADITVEEYGVGGITGESYTHASEEDTSGSFANTYIKNCYNTGDITAKTSSKAGGITGSSDSSNSCGATNVLNCYNTGEISGNSTTGGIVGENQYSLIQNCYNVGNVTGTEYVGGVSGANYFGNSTIKNCYNTGNVKGTSTVGGIVGRNYGSDTTKVENSYNIGAVTGDRSVSGAVGSSSYTQPTAYYNKDIVKGSGGSGTGLTTFQMTGLSSDSDYAMKSFVTDDWVFQADSVDGITVYYPVLSAKQQSPAPCAYVLIGTVDITGDEVYYKTLTANVTGSNASLFNYQWQRNGVNITGATSSTYQLTSLDINKNITVIVTADGYVGELEDKSGTISSAVITDIIINGEIKATYDETDHEAPSVTAKTVDGVDYEIQYKAVGTSYSNDVPSFKEVGEHRVYYKITATNHSEIYSSYLFTVEKATENNIVNLSIEDWTYGETAKVPSATAKVGEIVYTYSNSENGIYTSQVPTTAGTYWVKATVVETDSYISAEEKISFSINRATYDMSGISFVANSLTYNGNVQNLAITGTLPTGVSVSYSQGGKDVGEYQITATFTGDSTNYNTIEGMDAKLTITAKEVAVIWDVDTTYTYTGESLTVPTASFVGVNNDGTITLTVSEDDSKTFKNAGDYNFIASTANENYTLTNTTKAVTVAKAVSDVNITMAETSIYGETVAPVITSTFGQDTIVVKYYQSSTDDEPSSELITDVGTHKLEVLLPDNENYHQVKSVKQYTVTAKELSDANATITGAVDKTYTGDKIEQVAEDIVVKFGDKTLTNGTEYVIVYGNNTNVGNAKVTVYFVGNYTGKAITYFDITPKSISDYKVEDIASVTYTGSPIEPSVAVTGLTFGTDYTVEYKDNKNSGKATVTIKGTGNYKDTITKEFEINQATPTVVLEATKDPLPVMTAVMNVLSFGLLGDHEDTYTITATVTGVNGEKPTGTVTIMDGTNTIASNLTVTDGIATYAWSDVTAKNYELTAEFTSSDNNYTNKTSDAVGYTIEKAEQSISISDVGTKTFGDSDFNLVVNGVQENAKLSYVVTGSAVVVDENGKVTILSKGEVTIKVTAEETTNYNTATATTTFKVGQKAIQESDFTFNFDNLVYTGSEITPVTSTLTSDDYTIEYSNNTDAGTATVTIKGAGNYSETISKTFTINPQQLTVTGTSVANKIYDGTTSATAKIGTVSENVEVTAVATFDNKNVGTGKDVTVVYSITDTNYIAPVTETVKADITAKQLAIGGTEVSNKSYDANNTAIVTTVGTVADNVTGETVNVTAVATFNEKNVGIDKDVTVVYSITDTNYIAPVDGTVKADIKAIDLTVTPDTLDKFYGENDATLTYTFSGNLTDETPDVTGTLIRVSGEEIGTYKVSQNNFNIVDNGNFITSNYNLVFVDTVVYTIKKYTADAKVAEKSEWFNDKTVTLTAPTGYTISLTNGVTDTFTSELTIDTTEGKAQEVVYFLRNENGAISTGKTFVYNNEKVAPTGTVTIDTSTWDKFLETITFGIYKADDVEVSITSTDELSGVKSTEYYVSETAKTVEELKAITDWTEYEAYSITAEDAKTIVVYAKITDNAGNVTFVNSDGVLFDKTAPSITGVENLKFYKTDLNIKVTDANLETVTLDGEEVESEFVIKAGTEQNYELLATDKAGNSKKIYFRTYVEKAPVDDVIESLLPSDGDAFSKMVINNLTEEVITNTDKETAKDNQEEVETLNKLDVAFQEVNGNITVISTKPVIEKEIEDDKKVVIAEVVPQGLAVAVYGINVPADDIVLSLSVSQKFSEDKDDFDKLVFEVKPLVSVNGADPTVIPNDDIKSPVTFRLYLNDSFKGTVCKVEHIKENGEIEVYESLNVCEDEIGKYTELSVSEFSNFKVSEIKYKVSVDGVITEYKTTEKVTLVVPTKDGYEFKGFVSEDVTITNNEFTMPEKDVTITSVWEAKPSTPDTGDSSNVVLNICMMLVSLMTFIGIFINKKRILNK